MVIQVNKQDPQEDSKQKTPEEIFTSFHYRLEINFLNVTRPSFRLLSLDKESKCYIESVGFGPRDDIRFYTNEDKKVQLFGVQYLSGNLFWRVYKVVDFNTKKIIGKFKLSLPESFLKEKWIIMDSDAKRLGYLQSTNIMAMYFKQLPNTFYGVVYNTTVCTFKRPFIVSTAFTNVDINFSEGVDNVLDKRILLGLAVLVTGFW